MGLASTEGLGVALGAGRTALVKVFPGDCSIEVAESVPANCCWLKKAKVHLDAAVWLSICRKNVRRATAGTAPDKTSLSFAPYILFRLISGDRDFHRINRIERPHRSEPPAD